MRRAARTSTSSARSRRRRGVTTPASRASAIARASWSRSACVRGDIDERAEGRGHPEALALLDVAIVERPPMDDDDGSDFEKSGGTVRWTRRDSNSPMPSTPSAVSCETTALPLAHRLHRTRSSWDRSATPAAGRCHGRRGSSCRGRRDVPGLVAVSDLQGLGGREVATLGRRKRCEAPAKVLAVDRHVVILFGSRSSV